MSSIPLSRSASTPARVARLVLALAGLSAVLGLPLRAQQPAAAPPEDYVRAHYTKYEYRIAMRDGVHLFTSIYVPKDTSRPYPFLINRTPYSVGPYGVDQYRKLQ